MYFYVCMYIDDGPMKKTLKSILNQLLFFKYELRNIDEKINIIIKNTESNIQNNTNNSTQLDTDVYCLETLLPITCQDKLEELEAEISKNKNLRSQFVCIKYKLIKICNICI